LPASTEVRLARAIRPFPVPQLLRALVPVHQLASDLAVETARMLDPQPVDVIEWRQALGHLADALDAIEVAAGGAKATCMGLFDSAEKDRERAISAATFMLEGLAGQETPDA
jgi:hypothetical protein